MRPAILSVEVEMWIVLLTGCRGVDAAPTGIDDLAHYLWRQQEQGTPEESQAAIENLHAALGADVIEDAIDGTISPLTREEAALVDNDDEDPTLAQGVYMAKLIHCDMDTFETIVSHPDQDRLYTDLYDHYTRNFEGDRDAWVAGSLDDLHLTFRYTGSALGATYDAASDARLQRIQPVDNGRFERVVFYRSYFPEPAVFQGNSDKDFRQDYQMELYWERAPGEIVHFYGMWREADWGGGFTSNDPPVQRLLLNALADFDDTTDELCANGVPAPE